VFESAELGHKIDKETYDKQVPRLRQELLAAQFELLEKAKFPVVVLISGVDGAGKGPTANLLSEWMDPRHIRAHAFPEPSDEERDRPMMWRFWRALPPRGRVGIFFGSWYTTPIVERVMGHTRTAELDQSIEQINRFERMLTDEGTLLVKLWFHLSKKAQKRRLLALEEDPDMRWRVRETDWQRFALYEKFRRFSEHTLRQTSSAAAPWIVVEGADPRYRNLTVGTTLLSALRERLDDKPVKRVPDRTLSPAKPVDSKDVIGALDFTRALPKAKYEDALEKWQGRLNLLSRERRFRKRSVIVVFEGNDAAGKGGAIRRLTQALDTRHYSVVPVAAPTEEERAQPYLWRFWRHIPRKGRFTIFDRSWYGRVLVERVEGFCQEADWTRAYGEINDFEEQLANNGAVVAKFWLAITQDEQLERFNQREKIGFKRFKITDEDWRNRKKWKAYERAVCDMVDRTSTRLSPWTLVEANDKNFARVKVLKTLCRAIEEVL
jgi:AMP-polyphosphate phosphotransferase